MNKRTRKRTLSRKQMEFLQILKNYIDKNGYAPTVRELSVLFGHSSSSTTHGYLQRLEKHGCISWGDTKSRTRTIRVIDGAS